MNRTFNLSVSDKNSNTYNFKTAMLVVMKFFTWDIHHKWAFVGGPTTSPSKSKMAGSGHIEFHKMLISLYQMKMFADSFVQMCNTRQSTDHQGRRKSGCRGVTHPSLSAVCRRRWRQVSALWAVSVVNAMLKTTRGQSDLTKSASWGPIPRLVVTPGGRQLYQ